MDREEKPGTGMIEFHGVNVASGAEPELLHADSPPGSVHAFCEYLKNSLGYDFLQFITAVDRLDGLELQYHVYSHSGKKKIIIKTRIGRINGRINTVSDIWRAADWHERELFDLFGIIFENHPNLKRLFLDDDFAGHPLLKDYTENQQ